MRLRLAPEERRRRIVDAAVPLFARKGFSGTTTKEIAEAASVSEGLVFKYFASKSALYAAILDHCQTANPEFERLAKLPPSTATLVEVVTFLTGYFVDVTSRPEAELGRHLLFMRSLLEDGEFATAGMQVFADVVQPVLAPCLAAARDNGDLAYNMTAEAAFRLMAQMQIMLATFALPGRPRTSDSRNSAARTEEAAQFILRGIGVRTDVVARFSGGTSRHDISSEPMKKSA